MNFDEKLKQYMDVVIRIGMNVQPGQTVIITASAQDYKFVRAATRAAYQAGAHHVEVFFDDPASSVIRLQEAPEDSLEITRDYLTEEVVRLNKNGPAVLAMRANDPTLFAGVDPARVQKMQAANGKAWARYQKEMGDNNDNWCLIQIPNPGWVKKLYPELSEEEGTAKLWDAIFQTSRIHTPDPVAAWREHIDNLQARSQYLNDKQYTALHYQAPGTDLTVGLPEGHIWQGATAVTNFDIVHVPNIPTEEVFTLPHKDKVNGVVRSSMPLNLRGTIIEDFTLTFKDGCVVDVQAEVGEEQLKMLLDSDEGARRLGEVALVPHSSPISQMGMVFFNTLYDENASCHIALGRAYRDSLQDGVGMPEEEFAEKGGNNSTIHTDFMIGSAEMNIDGVLADGTIEPIMQNGEWVFAV